MAPMPEITPPTAFVHVSQKRCRIQMILSNYNAEYGRATGGVINIVTKSGGNDFHGMSSGYFRNKAFQRASLSGKLTPTGPRPRQAGLYPHAIWVDLRRRLKRTRRSFQSYEYTQREEMASPALFKTLASRPSIVRTRAHYRLE